ncbi:MAG: extracellular solute-binding protein [Bacillota bacterium]|nr:extracellular solute-binding protein [Bacillota bacterium]
MKKFLLFALVLSLVLGTLVGCSSSTPDTQGPEEDGVVEITLTSWRTEEIEAFKLLNAEFNKEFPNIKVKYEPIKNTEYDSVLSMSLNTNTAADLMYIRPFDRGVSLFESGYLLEVTEENLPNLANVAETQRQVYMSEDGKLNSAPYIYVSYGFIYNKGIFEEHNLTEPATWDEFFSTLDTLKAKGVTPLALGTKDGWVMSEVVANPNYVNFLGGENWRKEMLAGEKKFTDEDFVGFLESIDKWKDYMPKSYEAIGYVEAQQLFLTEQAAIFPAGSWEIGYFQSQNPNIEFGVFMSPTLEKGDKQWLGFNGGAGVGINKNSEHVDEALIYANWLLSEEAQILTGNLMAGLYPTANVPADKIEDKLAKEWIEAAGSNGENFAVGFGLEKINKEEPSAGTLTMENVTNMLNGVITPAEAAKNIQEGLASWYKPLQ